MTTTLKTSELLERTYDFITNDEDGRVCDAINDDACTEVPRNFFLNVFNGTCTKLAEQLSSPQLVLPWLLAALGAPSSFVGLLVPVRRAGSMLPQLSIAGRIRRFARRKWFWVGAGITQTLALLLLTLIGLLAPSGLTAGVLVVLTLLLFSVASGVGSVAFKDVMAKTIPKTRRGRLLAMRSLTGGLLALVAGVLLQVFVADKTSLTPYVLLILASAALWAGGTVLFAAIDEPEGETEGGRNSLQEARAGWHLLQANPAFRRFVLARALLLNIRLSLPFYALFANEQTGAKLGNLGVFVIAASLARILSSPILGRFADRSSRQVMIVGGLLATLTGVAVLLISNVPTVGEQVLVYAVVFLLIGIAQSGVRLGRKTYLVDGAPADERPLYVALSNTLIGVVYLVSGALGLVADVFGVPVLLTMMIGLTVIGTGVAWSMPEAEGLAAPSQAA